VPLPDKLYDYTIQNRKDTLYISLHNQDVSDFHGIYYEWGYINLWGYTPKWSKMYTFHPIEFIRFMAKVDYCHEFIWDKAENIYYEHDIILFAKRLRDAGIEVSYIHDGLLKNKVIQNIEEIIC
jgi:hypothetical protein